MSRNKTILVLVSLVFICLAILCCVIVAFVLLSNQAPKKFSLIKDTGLVYFKQKESYTELKEPQIELDSGTYVKTEAGTAHVLLPDNSMISLDTNTELKIEYTNSNFDITQLAGNSWHRVQKLIQNGEYTVSTPGITAAVRGTIFAVVMNEVDEGSFVVENTINVSNKSGATETVDEGKIAVYDNDTLVLEDTPDEIKNTPWYSRNIQIDTIWKNLNGKDRNEFLKNFVKSSISIKKVPKNVESFLEQEDFEELDTNNFGVNTGFSAPNIEGTYVVDNWTVKYDKMEIYPVGKVIETCNYTFKDQTAEGGINVSCVCENDSGSGSGGYISGQNQCFTVYINQEGNYLQCNYKMPAIISGCVDGNGLTNLQYGLLLKSKEDTQACKDNVMPEGNLRIISINDAYAEKE